MRQIPALLITLAAIPVLLVASGLEITAEAFGWVFTRMMDLADELLDAEEAAS